MECLPGMLETPVRVGVGPVSKTIMILLLFVSIQCAHSAFTVLER